MNETDIRRRLDALSHNTPWAHNFDLGYGIHTVDPNNEQFVKKAMGLGKLANILRQVIPLHSRRQTLEGMSVIDLACGEGAHSVALAQQGARVLGVDGRQLYVDRASFVTDVLGVEGVRFQLGDVRTLTPDTVGKHELVLCSGILHHLGQSDFDRMIRTMAELCTDTLFIYTHISTPLSIEQHRLTGPVKSQSGLEGYLFREHKEGATAEEKYKQVRASLDNVHSFWATEESLYTALGNAGFSTISRLVHPSIFQSLQGSYRPIIIARI